jgi:hypothetical membrane protein
MNSPKPTGLIKLGGICGIIAPFIALACIGVAIMLTPWFSWTDNFLSDLAGPNNIGNAAFSIFNIGLIVAGLLGIFFGWALWESRMLKKSIGKLAVVLLIIDMASLWAIGIFPETSGAYHGMASVSFFILLPLVQLLFGISLYLSSEKRTGLIMLLLTGISLVAVPLFFIPPPVGSNAIAEIIPAISLALSSLVLGLFLFKHLARVQIEVGEELAETEESAESEGFT